MAAYNGMYDFGFLLNSTCPGGNGDDGSEYPPVPKRKRPNANTACIACRRRKIRCEGGKPWCTPCFMRGFYCEWANAPPKPRRPRTRRTSKVTASSPTPHIQSLPWIDNSGTLCPPINAGDYQLDPAAESDPGLIAQAGLSFSGAGSSSLPSTSPWLPGPAYPDSQFAPLRSDYSGLESAQPFTSVLTQQPVFSGLPFYASTPSARAQTVPAHHNIGNSSGAGNTADMTGFDFENILAQDSFNVDAMRRDISQDAWLDSVLQTGPCAGSDTDASPLVLGSSTEFSIQLPSASIPSNLLLPEDGFSDPSIYDVTMYGGAQVILDAPPPSPTEVIPDWAQFVLDETCFSGASYGV